MAQLQTTSQQGTCIYIYIHYVLFKPEGSMFSYKFDHRNSRAVLYHRECTYGARLTATIRSKVLHCINNNYKRESSPLACRDEHRILLS